MKNDCCILFYFNPFLSNGHVFFIFLSIHVKRSCDASSFSFPFNVDSAVRLGKPAAEGNRWGGVERDRERYASRGGGQSSLSVSFTHPLRHFVVPVLAVRAALPKTLLLLSPS